MFYGGTIFVDHASARISIVNQVSLGSIYTIRSKGLYELEASEAGVKIHTYRGDNKIYKSTAFQNELKGKHQKVIFSGVGAHGQHGLAGRSIGTAVNFARTMMLHQAPLWPAYYDMRL